MNYRNRLMGNTRVFNVNGGESAQGNGGGQGGQQGNPPPAKPQGLDAFADIWNPKPPQGNPPSNNGSGGNSNLPPGNNGQGGQGADYYSNQNYFQNQEVTTAMQTAWEARDFSGFQKAMGEWMRGIHQQLGAEMNTFGKHYYDKAVKDATAQAGNSYQVNQIFEQAYSKYPALKMPAVNKVAKEIIANGIKSGKSVDDSIELAHNYFKEVGTHFNKAPANPSGRGIVSYGDDNGGSPQALDVDALFGGQQNQQ